MHLSDSVTQPIEHFFERQIQRFNRNPAQRCSDITNVRVRDGSVTRRDFGFPRAKGRCDNRVICNEFGKQRTPMLRKVLADGFAGQIEKFAVSDSSFEQCFRMLNARLTSV